MSILPGTPAEENVTTTTVMGWLFRLNMMLIPFGSVCVFWLMVWLVSGYFGHETRISVLEAARNSNRPGISQSVNVGQADKVADSASKSQRPYLNVKEVALKEGVSDRAIIDWIGKGRIEPAPVKSGKEYTIAADYRVLPQDAACCGDEPDEEVKP